MISRRHVVHLVGTPSESQCQKIYKVYANAQKYAHGLAPFVAQLFQQYDHVGTCFPENYQHGQYGGYFRKPRCTTSETIMKLAYREALGLQPRDEDEWPSYQFFDPSLQEVDFYLYARPGDVPALLKWFDKHKDHLPSGTTHTIAVCNENKVTFVPASWSAVLSALPSNTSATEIPNDEDGVLALLDHFPSKWLQPKIRFSEPTTKYRKPAAQITAIKAETRTHCKLSQSVAAYRFPNTFDFSVANHPLPGKLGETAHVENKMLHSIATMEHMICLIHQKDAETAARLAEIVSGFRRDTNYHFALSVAGQKHFESSFRKQCLHTTELLLNASKPHQGFFSFVKNLFTNIQSWFSSEVRKNPARAETPFLAAKHLADSAKSLTRDAEAAA